MKTVRHPTAGRVVNTVAQSRWGRWQTAEIEIEIAPRSLLGGCTHTRNVVKTLDKQGVQRFEANFTKKIFIKPMISTIYDRFHVGVAFMNRRKTHDKI